VNARLQDVWRRLPATGRELPPALLLLGASYVPALDAQGTRLGELPDRALDGWGAVVIALQCLPLAVRRRWPVACLALVSVGFALDQLRGYHTFAGAALAIALISGGAHVERHRRATVVGLTVAYVALAVALDARGGTEEAVGYVTFYLLVSAAWAAGAWLRHTRSVEAGRRQQVAERTRTAERTRLARELHDVVTHHVTAMVVQTEAARYRTSDPEGLDRTLEAVADTGRKAVADLRHLLDVLDPGHGPDQRTPAVGDVLDLVERTRRAGQPVEYVEEGVPSPTPSGAELTVYRVVQEALTNALKHAHGSATAVRVRHDHEEISVHVSTEGPATTPPAPGSGRGLVGLRERVAMLGGELRAEPRPDGFDVHARIPVDGAS